MEEGVVGIQLQEREGCGAWLRRAVPDELIDTACTRCLIMIPLKCRSVLECGLGAPSQDLGVGVVDHLAVHPRDQGSVTCIHPINFGTPQKIHTPAQSLAPSVFSPPQVLATMGTALHDTLCFAFDQKQIDKTDGHLVHPNAVQTFSHISLVRDRLYRVSCDTQTGEEITQLLVPKSSWETIFQAAHYNPRAGHMEYNKTLDWIIAQFYWPGIQGDVCRWCASCPECQLVNQPAVPRVPLRPLPLNEVPFERIRAISPVDITFVAYAMRYPKVILTDHYTSFMSRTLQELYRLLDIKSIRTSVFYTQTDGPTERLNKMLKSMIHKFVHKDGNN